MLDHRQQTLRMLPWRHIKLGTQTRRYPQDKQNKLQKRYQTKEFGASTRSSQGDEHC